MIERQTTPLRGRALPRVALLGATGFCGAAVLDELLGRGHDVRALVRRPKAVAHLDATPGLTIVAGDALDDASVRCLLQDVDVVVHCLGVGGKGDGKPNSLVSDSVRIVAEHMSALGLRRIVCMSNLGVDGSGPFLVNKIVVPLFLRWLLPIIEDKEKMERHLAQTDLDWVAVRCPNIVVGDPSPVRISPDGHRLALSITTRSVAEHLADLVVAPRFPVRTPAISN